MQVAPSNPSVVQAALAAHAAHAGRGGDGAAAEPAAGTPRQWLRLAAADAVFALPIDQVREILQVGRLTVLPRMPAAIRGVMNLRGSVVPVIDLGARLGVREATVGRRSCIIVVEQAAQADRPALVAGVMVDAVFEVVDVDPAAVSAPPTLGTCVAPEMLAGVLQLHGRLLHLLDVPRVLSQADLTALVAAHAA